MKNLTNLFLGVIALAAPLFSVGGNSSTDPKKGFYIVIVADDDDKQTLSNIFSTLVNAEKIQKELNVELLSDEGPITGDVYVFGMKAESVEDLTFTMTDDEGNQVADNLVKLFVGKNYRALDVSGMHDGTYTIMVKNKANETKSKEIIIERGKILD